MINNDLWQQAVGQATAENTADYVAEVQQNYIKLGGAVADPFLFAFFV